MNMKRLRRVAVALIAALAVAPMAVAQVARGNIYGKVTDEQGAVLPGATVTLTGDFGTRTTTTDTSGGFRILNVDQGTQTLAVSLANFASVKRQVVVRTGENATIDFALKLAGVQENVEVTAETPVVDPKRVGTTTIITKDELANIPSSRDPWALMRTIPGVTVDRVNVAGSESGQQSQFTAKGADPKDSVWSIDGVVITDMAAIGSSPDYFTYDSFDEVHFSTAGAGVTVATGGLGINLAPKRGTNQFHGTANSYFTHDKLQWSNLPAELVGDPRLLGSDKADHTDQIFDWSADLGGPIVKDKLWFYGSMGENDIRIRRLTQSQDKTVLKTYNAKLNWQPTGNDMVSLFWFQGGKEKIGRTGAAGSLSHLEGTLWDQGKAWPGNPHGLTKLEWNHTFGPSFFVNLKGSTYNTGFDLVPQGGLETSKWVIDNVNAEGRGTGYAQYYERPQKTVTADASYFKTALGGTHELKFGGGWRDVKSSTERVNPGDKIQARFNPTSTRARFYRDAFHEEEGVYWHGYASDTFSLNRLTLDLGVRFDHQTSQKNPSQVAGNPLVPGGLLPDINFPGDSAPPITWDTFSPRLGATYALDSARKTVARVSLALYRGQLGNFEAGWTNPIRTSYVEYDWRDANGDQIVQTPEVDFSRIRALSNVNVADPTSLTSTFTVDPHYHANKDYQAVVGLDRELAPNLAASVAYTYRKSTDLTATQLLWGYYWYAWAGVNPSDYQPGESFCANGYCTTPLVLSDAALDRSDVTGGAVLTNRKDYSRTYNGLELSLVKRLSNKWMGRVAFSINDWREHLGSGFNTGLGGGTGSPNRTYYDSQTDGGIVASYGAGSGKVYFNNAKWQLNANLLYQLPKGFEVAGNLYGRQGYPNPIYSQVDLGALDGVFPVLADGTNMDTQRLPSLWDLDLRLAKSFALRGSTRLQLSAEMFNVFNSNTELTRVNDFSADVYGRLDEILAPRIVRFGARLQF
jgi:hypothetical protein